MQKLLTATALMLAIAGNSMADPAAQVTKYTASVTGIVCGACKSAVRKSFSKLPGVKADKITFTPGAKDGETKVTFDAASDKLTKTDAVKSLGDTAKDFVVVSLDKQK